MEQTNGCQRYLVKRRPREYPRTKQQENFINALQFCQIKKGITKAELQEKMKTCIPQYFKDLKEQEIASELPTAPIDNQEIMEEENVGERGEEEDYVLQPHGL